jgi:transposase
MKLLEDEINIPENQRHRQKSKRGRKRLFSAEIYKQRFVAERTFAWVDKFKLELTHWQETKSLASLRHSPDAPARSSDERTVKTLNCAV